MPSPIGKTEAGNAIHRRILILKILPHDSRGTGYTVKHIQEILANRFDIFADERTLQRDLQSLLPPAYPIEVNTRKPHSWKWQKGAHSMDIYTMDPQTALTFRVVDKFLRPLLPQGVLANLEPYLNIAKGVPGHDPDGNLIAWADNIQVFHRSNFLIPPKVDEQIVATLYQALYEGRRIKAKYQAKGRTEPKEYEVSPHGLIITDNIPCLVATLNEHTTLLQLLFPRFMTAELMDKPATVLEDFSLERYLEQEPLSYPVNEEPIRLKIRLPEQRGWHLKETRLSEDQVYVDLGRDMVEVTATVVDSLQLRFWLNGFGADLELLEPVELRAEFAAAADRMAQQYRKKKSRSAVRYPTQTDGLPE